MKNARCLLTFSFISYCCCCQTLDNYSITTIAGFFPDDEGALATEAQLDSPTQVSVAPDGTVFLGLSGVQGGLRRIDAQGRIARVSTGSFGASDFLVDGDRNIYYTFGGPEIYRVAVDGTATTWRPSEGAAQPRNLVSIALESSGNLLIADRKARRILRMTPQGSTSVVFGLGSGFALDSSPIAIATGPGGKLYVGTGNLRVSFVESGRLVPVIGTGLFGAPVIGSKAIESPLRSITSIAVGTSGEVYVSDSSSRQILKVNTEGTLELVAAGVSATDLSLTPAGELLYVYANSVWRVEADGSVRILAGRPVQFQGDGGPAIEALLMNPSAVVVGRNGDIIVADTGNNRIRAISSDGSISTIFGNGEPMESGDDGLGIDAQGFGPAFLTSDEAGTLYFSSGSGTVRKLGTDGVVRRVAGNGSFDYSGDGGPARLAGIGQISGLAANSKGEIFVSDRTARRIRKIDLDGTITTVAGNGSFAGGADGSTAVDSGLGSPGLLALDPEGGLVFEDFRAIRRVSPDGILSTIATTVLLGTPVDEPSNACLFVSLVTGIYVTRDGSLLLSSPGKICRRSHDGSVSLVAGAGFGFSGDGGPARSARLGSPSASVLGPDGTLYFADLPNHRVRALVPVIQ